MGEFYREGRGWHRCRKGLASGGGFGSVANGGGCGGYGSNTASVFSFRFSSSEFKPAGDTSTAGRSPRPRDTRMIKVSGASLRSFGGKGLDGFGLALENLEDIEQSEDFQG